MHALPQSTKSLMARTPFKRGVDVMAAVNDNLERSLFMRPVISECVCLLNRILPTF